MGPIKNQSREFTKFRYLITNEDDPYFELMCQSWKEVSDACGIPRSALYQMLKGTPPTKHRKWNIARISLDRTINLSDAIPHHE